MVAAAPLENAGGGYSAVAHVFTRGEAALVVQQLRGVGIDARVVADIADQATGPFDIVVPDVFVPDAIQVIDDIEVIEDPDDWFTERPIWQKAILLLVGVAAVLLPLFFAVVAIFSA